MKAYLIVLALLGLIIIGCSEEGGNSRSDVPRDLKLTSEITEGQTGDGNLIWAKNVGVASNYGSSSGITALSDNSIVVTGPFYGSASFGQGEPNQTDLNADLLDNFIARYNPDGTLSWVKGAGGASEYYDACGITMLSDNSIVVTGLFQGSATFGQYEPNQTVLTSDSCHDIFVARYNPNGTLAWVKGAGGVTDDDGNAITALSDDSTVVTGFFNGSAIFGPGESNQTTLTSAGSGDIFIARYNPDGTLAWAKRAGGIADDVGKAIITLLDNSIVVTGSFTESAKFGPSESNQTILTSAGGEDIFIARYNPDGALTWVKRAGGASTYDWGYGITALSDSSIVVTGLFEGSVTFGPGELNQTALTSAGDIDIFIARYNQDGTLAWAKRAGGASYDRGNGITTLSDNTTVVTGEYCGPAIFGSGEPNQTVLTTVDSNYINAFIARYNVDGTLAYAKHAGGSQCSSFSSGITTLSDNSSVVIGFFQGSATFGTGEPDETVLSYAKDLGIFIARFNP
jgi:uncharacterized delta-60 repeat protein